MFLAHVGLHKGVHKGVKKGSKHDLMPKSPKWSPNGPRMEPKWTQKGQRVPKWAPNGANMDPNVTRFPFLAKSGL